MSSHSSKGPKFSYGDNAMDGNLFFKATRLLFEREISSQDLKVFDFEGTKAFFLFSIRNQPCHLMCLQPFFTLYRAMKNTCHLSGTSMAGLRLAHPFYMKWGCCKHPWLISGA